MCFSATSNSQGDETLIERIESELNPRTNQPLTEVLLWIPPRASSSITIMFTGSPKHKIYRWSKRSDCTPLNITRWFKVSDSTPLNITRWFKVSDCTPLNITRCFKVHCTALNITRWLKVSDCTPLNITRWFKVSDTRLTRPWAGAHGEVVVDRCKVWGSIPTTGFV